MTILTERAPISSRHGGPHLRMLAVLYVVLFNAGLAFVTYWLTPPPYFPGPDAGPNAIVTYFQMRPSLVRISAFLSIGAAIAVGALAASMVGRLRFLGARTAAVDIALFAGLAVAFDQMASHLLEWTLTWPGIAQDRALTLALYYLLIGFGGAAFSLPMGIFVGCVSVAARPLELLPGWITWPGIAIAIIGGLSWLNLLAPTFPLLGMLIPLTRFPSFAWLIAAGFALPARARRSD